MKRSSIFLYVSCFFAILTSCKSRNTAVEEQIPVVSVQAGPVAIGTIEKEVSFNGSTVYLKKSQVISPISGYVVSTGISFGQEVRKDMVLFEMKTREGKALETLDQASGMISTIKILANAEGFISDLNVSESGVYVAEGSVLCNIADYKNLLVRVNVPFEYVSLLGREKKCRIRLVDGSVIAGSVSRILPSVDGSNQTQTVLIKPATVRMLPENLNLILNFVGERHEDALLVPKPSLQANETQDKFWVMKIERGNTAVKIPVRKGLERGDTIEVISAELKVNDLVINEGAYGLPDSTQVRLVK